MWTLTTFFLRWQFLPVARELDSLNSLRGGGGRGGGSSEEQEVEEIK